MASTERGIQNLDGLYICLRQIQLRHDLAVLPTVVIFLASVARQNDQNEQAARDREAEKE